MAITAFFVVLVTLGVLETLAPAFEGPSSRVNRWPSNFGLMLLDQSIQSAAPISALWAADWARDHSVGILNTASVPGWVAASVTVLVLSLNVYVLHFLFHKFAFFWRIHRVHHLDTHIDISTSGRHHPLEAVAGLCGTVPVVFAFGLNSNALIVYAVFSALVGAASHANLRLSHRLDQSLRLVFVTPNMHSIHHSAMQAETDSNYGDVFTFWDRLFGTYKEVPEARYNAMMIGLEEIRDERTSYFWWQIKSPIFRSLSMDMKEQQQFAKRDTLVPLLNHHLRILKR